MVLYFSIVILWSIISGKEIAINILFGGLVLETKLEKQVNIKKRWNWNLLTILLSEVHFPWENWTSQFYFKAPWLQHNIRREAPEEDILGCLPNQINPLFMQYYVILEWFLLGADIVTRCYLGVILIPLFQMCLHSSTWRFCAYAVLPPHVSHCLGTSSMWGVC